MEVFGLLLAVVLTLVVALFAAILGCLVVRRLVLDRRTPGLVRLWPWALLCAVTVVGLATAPLLAASRAEARTGWSDQDGDGVVDGFLSGSGDWHDVNGAAFASSWLLGLTICIVVLAAGSWYLTRFRLARPLVP